MDKEAKQHWKRNGIKSRKDAQILLKRIWYDICILERDYGIEFNGQLFNVTKFTLECVADKWGLDLGLAKRKK